jgi:hypothetical protein
MNIYISKNIFYVYAYLRSSDSTIAPKGTPYYIGKGSNGRAYQYHRHIPVPKDKSNIIFLESNLSENQAFYIEKFLIKCYGRKDLGTGILLNRTDGGEGSSGTICSDETREKLSIANKGENNPMYGKIGENNPMYKKIHSTETKAKMSAMKIGKNNNRYGIPHSEETKAKQRAAMKDKIYPIVKCPHCGKPGRGSNMKRYHFDKCKLVHEGGF